MGQKAQSDIAIDDVSLTPGCRLGYSDYDVFLEIDRASLVYRCKKYVVFFNSNSF